MRALKIISISFVLMAAPSVSALSSEHKQLFGNGINYFDPISEACGNASVTDNAPDTGDPSKKQTEIAKTIIGIAKTYNLGRAGALIGLMVGLAESSLQNYANSTVPLSLQIPHDAVGSDHDSVGVFQQRPSMGWSTIATGSAALNNIRALKQLMTPAYAAQAFFGSPPGSNAPSALSKGLQNHIGWQNLPPELAAQSVQASGDSTGSNYLAQKNNATSLLDRHYDESLPVPLPVPIKGGQQGTGDDPLSKACGSRNSGSIAGCVNPLTDDGWVPARTDQGVDYVEETKLPVKAICDGKIISTDGSGWPGGVFILIKLSSGPHAGKCTFVAEHLTDVLPVGTEVKAGQTIANTIPGYPWTEWGWAQGPQTPSTPYNGAPNGTAMPGGKAFARFLRHLGASTRDDPGSGPEYEGATCN